MPNALYGVKVVCQKTGLKATTLHVWEKRYRAIVPARCSNNQRLYTSEDVDKLSLLVAAKDMGHRIGSIAHLSLESLRAMIPSPSTLECFPEVAYKKAKFSSIQAICARTLDALLSNNFNRVHSEVETARQRLGHTVFALDYILLLLHRAQQKIEDRSLSTARLHILHSIIRSCVQAALAKIILQYPKKADASRSRVLIATMSGDHCDMEIMLAALIYSGRGMTVHYLGANVSAAHLAEAVHDFRIDRAIIKLPQTKGSNCLPEAFFQILLPRISRLCEVWAFGQHKDFRREELNSQSIHHMNSLRELYQAFPLR